MVKCVKFVAMQQNRATLIYDFKTMKVKVESCLKNSPAIQNFTIQNLVLKV